MRTLFISLFLVAIGVIFLLPSSSRASSQSFDLRIQILPVDDGEEEPDDEATTTPALPPQHTTTASPDSDSALERAHDTLIDSVDDLIGRILTPDAGRVYIPGGGVQGGSRDLSFVWSEDDAVAVRMLIDIPSEAAGRIREVLITHLAFESGQVLSVTDGDMYDISMYGEDGRKLTDFSDHPISVTMRIPDFLQGRNPLGLFYFDEDEQVWTRVRGAVFSGQNIMFVTDHLSIFGIFALNPSMAHANELVSKEGGMTDVSTRSVAGSTAAKNMRTVAEIIVSMLYACIAAILILIFRFCIRCALKKI